jgi:outer membrane protein assembly factor BamB
VSELILWRHLLRSTIGLSASVRHGAARRSAGAALFPLLAILPVLGMTGCADTSGRPNEITQLQTPSLARLWATDLDLASGDAFTEVHVREKVVIIYSRKGRVYVLNRANGSPIFGADVPGGNFRLWDPVVLRDYIVFPTTNTLEVYTLAGIHDRSINVRAAIRADCVGEVSDVYVPVDSPQGGARLMRFDLTKKNITIPIWELQVWKGAVASSPAIVGDSVYVAADVGMVYAVGGAHRDPIWPLTDPDNIFDARARIIAPLKADAAGLYVSCLDGHLYCLHLTRGTTRWHYFASGPLEHAPVLTSDTVYVIDPNRGWLAIDKIDNPDLKVPQFIRTPRWARKDIIQILSQDDKYVYAKDKSNHIVALDKKSGDVRFQSSRSDFYRFGSNSYDGISYTISSGGRVVAIRPVFQPGQSGEVVKIDDEVDPLYAVTAR